MSQEVKEEVCTAAHVKTLEDLIAVVKDDKSGEGILSARFDDSSDHVAVTTQLFRLSKRDVAYVLMSLVDFIAEVKSEDEMARMLETAQNMQTLARVMTHVREAAQGLVDGVGGEEALRANPGV